jgi:ribosome biogenesis protein BMS1
MCLGCGDFTISAMSALTDPCPTPEQKKRLEEEEASKLHSAAEDADDDSGTKKRSGGRRRLSEKDKLLYAPMSDTSGVLYDKDAVYLTLAAQDARHDRSQAATSGQEAGHDSDDEAAGQGDEVCGRKCV